jgi:hypothetical protein
MTRPSSEPYYKRHQPPPNNCSGRQTSTSPWVSEPRTSSEAQNPRRPHHGEIRTSSRTSAGKKGPARRCTPPGHLPLELAIHLAEKCEHWMRSLVPVSVSQGHAPHPAELQDFKHSVGHGLPFQPLPPPLPRGEPSEPRQPQQQEEGNGGAFPCVDKKVNIIFGCHGAQENRRQQKLNDR